MTHDEIAEVEIDGIGQLRVKPVHATFPYIYREGMEVHWDPTCKVLYSPKPREWTYLRWFEPILVAAAQQDCQLQLSAGTRWLNVDRTIRNEILNFAQCAG